MVAFLGLISLTLSGQFHTAFIELRRDELSLAHALTFLFKNTLARWNADR